MHLQLGMRPSLDKRKQVATCSPRTSPKQPLQWQLPQRKGIVPLALKLGRSCNTCVARPHPMHTLVGSWRMRNNALDHCALKGRMREGGDLSTTR